MCCPHLVSQKNHMQFGRSLGVVGATGGICALEHIMQTQNVASVMRISLKADKVSRIEARLVSMMECRAS